MGLLRGANIDKLQARGDVPGLAKLLQHEDSARRSAAAQALAELKDERGFEPLVVALWDADPNVRRIIESALVSLGDARAAPALLEVFWRLGDLSAAVALRDLGAAQLLIESLFDPERRKPLRYPRAQLHEAVRMFGEPVLDAIESRLTDPDAPGRWMAVALLAGAGEKAPKPTRSRVEGLLTRVLEDKDEELRKSAAKALEKLTGTKYVVPTGLSSGRLAGGKAKRPPTPEYEKRVGQLIGSVRLYMRSEGKGAVEDALKEIPGLADHRFLKPLIEIIDLEGSPNPGFWLLEMEKRIGKIVTDVADRHWRDLATSLASDDAEVRELAVDALSALNRFYTTWRTSTPSWWSADFVAQVLKERETES